MKRQIRKQPRKDSKAKRVNFDNERVSRFERDLTHSRADNDVSWYAKNPELLRSAASLGFSNTTGQPIGWKGDKSQTVPGVLALYYLPSIGGRDNDAVNAAKESIYSFVVHANSRNTSYNSSDQMLVILAGMQLFSALGYATRAYGVMRTFDQRNKYLPQALIAAMGFSYTDLQANLSNMWFDINEMIARSSQIWIPNTLPLMDRWYWMSSSIYQDSESVKGQFYLFNPLSFFGYNELASSSGGELQFMNPDGSFASQNTAGAYRTNTAQYTWSQFKAVINGMFDALLNSEDRGVIMGDILKAYGADRIYALKPIPADYSVVPIYDREVLTQIENASVFSGEYFSFKADADTNKLITKWGVRNVDNPFGEVPPSQSILNFHQKEVPTPEQVMVATRLTVLGSDVITTADNKVAQIAPLTIGTEYVTDVQAYVFGASGLSRAPYVAQWSSGTSPSSTFALELCFDWSPWIYWTTPLTAVPQGPAADVVLPEVKYAYGDYDNYTVLEISDLRKMHTTAVYSEFGVPTIG